MHIPAELYDNLPDDDELAFVIIERHLRDILKNSNGDELERIEYMNLINATALEFNIEHPYFSDGAYLDTSSYNEFYHEVTMLVHKINLRKIKRIRRYTVSFSNSEKQKIRVYCEKIKKIVEEQERSIEKATAIYARIDDLIKEVDQDRTRYEAIADNVRAISRITSEVTKESVDPIYRMIGNIFNVVNSAKESEEIRRIPSPENRKKLSPPDREHNSDDDIPF